MKAFLPTVFPAPAGMNRFSATIAAKMPSVPRACGDEPIAEDVQDGMRMCSPRLRG